MTLTASTASPSIALLSNSIYSGAALFVLAMSVRTLPPRTASENLGLSLGGFSWIQAGMIGGVVALNGVAFAILGSSAANVFLAGCGLLVRMTKSHQVPARQSQPSLRKLVIWYGSIAVLIYGILPHQVVFLLCFLLHTWTTAVSQHRLRSQTNSDVSAVEHYNQCYLFLLALFWSVPLKGPVLFVWIRNMVHGWFWRHGQGSLSIYAGDHNPLEILPLLVLSEHLRAGRRVRAFEIWPLPQLAIIAACVCFAGMLGPRKPFVLYDQLNIIITLLLFGSWWVESSAPRSSAPYRPLPPIDETESIPMTDKTSVVALSLPESIRTSQVAQIGNARTRRPRQGSDLLGALDLVDEYSANWRRASERFADGFIRLGKAQSSAGFGFAARIGRSGWDARLEAQVICECDESGAMAVRFQGLAKDAKNNADPLYQFGGLPSASLRSAQRSFIDALRALLDERGVLHSAKALDEALDQL